MFNFLKRKNVDSVVLKVNGVPVDLSDNNILIEITGTVGRMDVRCVGSVKSLSSNSFTIQVNGDTGPVETSQGNITCKNVNGNAITSQGNITCENVGGSVKTGMGNIKYKK